MTTYRFNPQSIAKMRTRLGIKQTEMAAQLGIPKNVLSEWETGKAEPSLASLAAIYSIGIEHDHEVSFFTVAEEQKTQAQQTDVRTTAFVYWDGQNVAPSKKRDREWEEFINHEVRERFPGALVHSYAFISPNQGKSFSHAEGWDIKKSRQNQDETIIRQIRKNTKDNPMAKAVFLVAFDGGYLNVVKEAQERGVAVHLVTVLRRVSRRLLKAIDTENVVTLP